jgi:hypothetical protein
LPIGGTLGHVELAREVATLVMLVAIGTLTGRNTRARLGYAAVAFGVWDIFYYAFLKVICGWPKSLFDWDVLFLLPLPWWGPVLAPMCIALLMIGWGTLATQPGPRSFGRTVAPPSWWRAAWIGVALALYVFMADSLRAAHEGIDATRVVLPAVFNWPLFVAALVLMAAPVAQMAWRMRPAIDAAPRSPACKTSMSS